MKRLLVYLYALSLLSIAVAIIIVVAYSKSVEFTSEVLIKLTIIFSILTFIALGFRYLANRLN